MSLTHPRLRCRDCAARYAVTAEALPKRADGPTPAYCPYCGRTDLTGDEPSPDERASAVRAAARTGFRGDPAPGV